MFPACHLHLVPFVAHILTTANPSGHPVRCRQTVLQQIVRPPPSLGNPNLHLDFRPCYSMIQSTSRFQDDWYQHIVLPALHVASPPGLQPVGNQLPEFIPLFLVCRFWADLSRIPWCPVLQSAPVVGLPWPTRSLPQRLAAPRLVRPAADMWLVSAAMSVLDGECR